MVYVRNAWLKSICHRKSCKRSNTMQSAQKYYKHWHKMLYQLGIWFTHLTHANFLADHVVWRKAYLWNRHTATNSFSGVYNETKMWTPIFIHLCLFLHLLNNPHKCKYVAKRLRRSHPYCINGNFLRPHWIHLGFYSMAIRLYIHWYLQLTAMNPFCGPTRLKDPLF